MAKELGVSLPTLKRWLTGDGLSTKDLLRLLEAVGSSLVELDQYLNPSLSGPHLTWDQERLLARTPRLLEFWESYVVERHDMDRAQKVLRLSSDALTDFLLVLKKAKLMSWTHLRYPVPLPNGPLEELLRRRLLERLSRLGVHEARSRVLHLNESDLAELRVGIVRLLEDFTRRSARRRGSPQQKNAVQLKPYGLFLGLSPFD